MLNDRKTILTCGDSFTFGSEIINPTLSTGKPEPYKLEQMINGLMDYSPENDEYRSCRTWPAYLGELSSRNVINIAKPAISNLWIYHSTMSWILKNYIERNKPTDDLIVIVGWTSVLRKEFFFNGQSATSEKTLNVNGDFKLESKDIQEFFKYYALTTDFDTQGSYDLVNCSFNLYNFCQSRNIKCYFFNALPDEHHAYQLVRFYKDLNVSRYIDNFRHVTTCWSRDMYSESLIKWSSIPTSSFLQKDRTLNSFSNYIRVLPLEERLHGVHPSPQAHKIWADVMYDFIFNENELAYTPNTKLI
jgi:hypothetical protein